MANNFVRPGSEITVRPSSAVESGQIYEVNNGLIGIAESGISAEELSDTTIPEDAKLISISLEGIYKCEVVSGDTPAINDVAYIDATDPKKATTNNASGKKIGTFFSGVDSNGLAEIQINKFYNN